VPARTPSGKYANMAVTPYTAKTSPSCVFANLKDFRSVGEKIQYT
jgi:hypothetical protein